MINFSKINKKYSQWNLSLLNHNLFYYDKFYSIGKTISSNALSASFEFNTHS